MDSEAVRLFLDRARQQRPDFTLDADNRDAVARLCRRLDGIPLAIELAAARVRAIAVDEIEKRLDQRFALLTGGDRIALPRQQTLQALIDWSYNLLDPSEQELLERLSVFAGSFDLQSAEAIGSRDQNTPVSGRRPRARRQEPDPVRRHQQPLPTARKRPRLRRREATGARGHGGRGGARGAP